MKFLDKVVKNFANVSEDDYYDEWDADNAQEDAFEPEQDALEDEPRRPSIRARVSRESKAEKDGNVINMRGSASNRVVLSKPLNMDDATVVADHLKANNIVFLNLETCDNDMARHIVDFLSGVAYAIGGKFKAAGQNNFVITPSNVDLAGADHDLTGELGGDGIYF